MSSDTVNVSSTPSDEAKSRTKLRLITARLFTCVLRDPDFRQRFVGPSGWTPTSPIVPCEHDTLFGEVHSIAVPALRGMPGTVAIPVLHFSDDDDDSTISMSVLTMRLRLPGEESPDTAIDIDSISHKVTMAQVCETLAPDKQWALADLSEAYYDLARVSC